MKKVMRVVGFEAKKFLLDKSRVIFFILAMAAFVAVLSWIMFYFFDAGEMSPTTYDPYNSIIESGYRKTISEIQAKMATCHNSSSQTMEPCFTDSYYLSQIKLYEALIKYKLASGYYQRGFTANGDLTNYWFIDFTYQSFVYTFFPIIIATSIHNVFTVDESKGYSRNYVLLGVERKNVVFGKTLFSGILLILLFVCLNLPGLFFSSGKTILFNDGENYRVIRNRALFFNRMFEMTVALIAIYLLFLVINRYVKNHTLSSSITIFLSFSFMPLVFAMLQEYHDVNRGINDVFHNAPFYSMVTSNGWQDSGAISRLGIPLACIGILLVTYFIRDIIPKVFTGLQAFRRKKANRE